MKAGIGKNPRSIRRRETPIFYDYPVRVLLWQNRHVMRDGQQ